MLDLFKLFTEELQVVDASSTPNAWGDSKHEVVEEQHIAEKLPSAMAKDTKSKKSILHSQPRANHFFIRRQKNPKCGICKKQNNACKVSNKSLRSAWMGLSFYNIRRVDHGRSHNSELGA